MSDLANVQKDLSDVIAAIPVNLGEIKNNCKHLTAEDAAYVYLWLQELNSQLVSIKERVRMEVPVGWPTINALSGIVCEADSPV